MMNFNGLDINKQIEEIEQKKRDRAERKRKVLQKKSFHDFRKSQRAKYGDVASSNSVRPVSFTKMKGRAFSPLSDTPNESFYPGRDTKGNYTGGWGLSAGARFNTSSSQHLGRAATFAFGGAGYKREALLNSMGVLTKNQMSQKGLQGLLPRVAVPLSGLATFGMASNSEDPIMAAAALITSEVGASVGFRTGQSMQYAAQASRGKGIGRFNYGLRGGLIGAAAGIGAGIVLGMTQDSNNMIARTASKLRGEMGPNLLQTRQSLTMRQKGLQQISKSALNNRGQILGREAMVLNGMI